MTGKSLFKIAGLIAIITIFSKIVGFGRDVVTAQAYGATLVSDAYFYAYQMPALAIILLGGLGGPFHTATIAIFSKLTGDITQKPQEETQKLLNNFITITAIVFTIISILMFFFSEQIITMIASGAKPEMIKLAAAHLKIMSPIMLIGGVIGIFYGIANVYQEFLYTSLSPTVLSVVVIAAILLFHHDANGIVLAWATLIGAVLQLALQLPVFLKSGFNYSPVISFKEKEIFKLGEILFPAMLGTTIGQINIYVDMFFASRLQEGAWSAIGYANRIFQFPVGILMTAFLVPLFPMFSTFVGKKDMQSLKYYFHKGVNTLWFISFPILAYIIIFAQDGIAVLFQRGAFDHTDTIMVSEALVYLSLSIIPYIARDTLTRIFYSFDDSKTPFYVAMFSIGVKALMNFIFISVMGFGIGGITLSTTAVTLCNAVLLGICIRDKVNLEYPKFFSPILKISAATGFMSVVCVLLNLCLTPFLSGNNIMVMVKLLIITLITAPLYFVFALMLKVEVATQLVNRIKPMVTRFIGQKPVAEE